MTNLITFMAICLSATVAIASHTVEYSRFHNTAPFSPSQSWAGSSGHALLSFAFLMTNSDLGISGLSVTTAASGPIVRLQPLFYPNPFRLQDGAELGYQLAEEMDIEIRIYNMFGQELYRQFFPKGLNGGFGGDNTYNKIPFNASSFGGVTLPAAIYFYFLVNNGSVIAKGKFAIKP